MNKYSASFTNIDEYIAMFNGIAKEKLQQMRKIIQEAAPEATETINYQMPTFEIYGKYLAYFAAFKNHIGFYPFPTGVEMFKEMSKDYATTKGGIQFPLDKEIPVSLVKEVIKYRVAENQKKLAK